jgi:ornithine cyclodeaminase/alanine dehydrogenase-like protein (mu-crystallin family)
MSTPAESRATNSKLLYLSQSEVASLGVTITEVIGAVEKMFEEKAAGRVEMPPKPGIHPQPDAFIHAMPAYIPAMKSAGIKWVGGFPENNRRDLPYVSGLIVLNDPETGLPLAVMDCVWITAQRTAAASAIAARHLARPDAETVGILGCGVQGRSHLQALHTLFPLRKVMAYDIHEKVRESYASSMSGELDLEVVAVDKPQEAVTGCEIVVTAGPILKVPHATIQSGWLDPGGFAALIDFDSYWHTDALHEVDKFCTDDRAQLDFYREDGYFQTLPPIHAELAELVAGQKPGRENADERTIACNLGLALEDIAVAPLVYGRAIDRQVGTWLPL